jgi:hypothetical protein
MRQLQEKFPGHPAFTPSNSVNWQRCSKYATGERDVRLADGARGQCDLRGSEPAEG